eukprot:TRINITY_DN10623_c0_g1_i1.p1 TRINITY_DN10623_c0_g1~~TRINITY_DN10623_c0_g1_i1.p1  ORF type:complete len:300 (-),score=42.74 TRINITY_DN10623_c0_g1_i1:127-1026(-)
MNAVRTRLRIAAAVVAITVVLLFVKSNVRVEKEITGFDRTESNHQPNLVNVNHQPNPDPSDPGRFSPSELELFQECVPNYSAALGPKLSTSTSAFMRHEHPLLTPGDRVIEIGGNMGVDTAQLHAKYQTEMFVFEPLPFLCKQLDRRFHDNSDVHIFCFGLTSHTRNATFAVKTNSSVFSEDVGEFRPASGADASVPVVLRSISEVLHELQLSPENFGMITINCEGCEYELLEHMLRTDMVPGFREIQIAWHPVPADFAKQACAMRTLLLRTHKIYFSFDFWWESWVRRDVLWTFPVGR